VIQLQRYADKIAWNHKRIGDFVRAENHVGFYELFTL